MKHIISSQFWSTFCRGGCQILQQLCWSGVEVRNLEDLDKCRRTNISLVSKSASVQPRTSSPRALHLIITLPGFLIDSSGLALAADRPPGRRTLEPGPFFSLTILGSNFSLVQRVVVERGGKVVVTLLNAKMASLCTTGESATFARAETYVFF